MCQSETSLQMAIKNALQFLARRTLVHHQWAHQEFSPVRLSACKASILLRKTARAVVRSVRRTLFAPRFRSRSIVVPAHKPAAIFSDQSPRDEHERLREARVRPEGNGATKKPQHSLRLFLVHHRGLSRVLYFSRTVCYGITVQVSANYFYIV